MISAVGALVLHDHGLLAAERIILILSFICLWFARDRIITHRLQVSVVGGLPFP